MIGKKIEENNLTIAPMLLIMKLLMKLCIKEQYKLYENVKMFCICKERYMLKDMLKDICILPMFQNIT